MIDGHESRIAVDLSRQNLERVAAVLTKAELVGPCQHEDHPATAHAPDEQAVTLTKMGCEAMHLLARLTSFDQMISLALNESFRR